MLFCHEITQTNLKNMFWPDLPPLGMMRHKREMREAVTGELQAKVNSINGNTHRLGPRVLLDDLKRVFVCQFKAVFSYRTL